MNEDFEKNWQIILDRNQAYDERFVYGVRSTGIYCRPSCPSRRPHREQVVFFHSSAEAEQAGFRACKRCHPGSGPAPDAHLSLMQAVCRYLDENQDEKASLQKLSEQFHLSPYHLQRTFKRAIGITPHQYWVSTRSKKIKAELKEQKSVTTAMYQAGYNSSSSLYKDVNGHFGMTPTSYQQGGKSMTIDYTISRCALGMLLVAATSRGICAVNLGSSDAELEADLVKEFPHAHLHRNDPLLQPWVHEILRYLDGNPQKLDLPLDIQATTFQWKVWETLRSIPYGQTRTYSQVAEQIGSPGAARAVARACASNQAALIIPCHRVIGVGGKLSGYRWGIDRKQKLLAMEKEQPD
jgi:AraC family transcriptional regulator, regulatory protein of adaptative response / methylated-DNA-[protein]-cysteine methyltransferase